MTIIDYQCFTSHQTETLYFSLKLCRRNFAASNHLTTSIMKKIVTIISMILLSVNAHIINADSDVPQSKIDMIIQMPDTWDEPQRSLSTPLIEAYIDHQLGTDSVLLNEIGTAEVYILNYSNQIIDYTLQNTDTFSTVYLSTDGPGFYSVVVISDTCYAEGYFTL